MKTTASKPESNADQSKAKSTQILPDGTHVKTSKTTRAEPDGSLVIKKKTVTYPPTSELVGLSMPFQKKIKTTIVRTNPRGDVCSEVTTEEIISNNGSNLMSGASGIQSLIIRDGSGVIVTKNDSQLDDGTSSVVATKILVKHVGGHPEVQDALKHTSSSDISGPCSACSQILSNNHPDVNSQDKKNNETGANSVDIVSITQPPLATKLHTKNQEIQPERFDSKDIEFKVHSSGLEIFSRDVTAHPGRDFSNRNVNINFTSKFAAPNKPPPSEEHGSHKDRPHKKFQNEDLPEMIDNTLNQPVPITYLTSTSPGQDSDAMIFQANLNEWNSAHHTVKSGYQTQNNSKNSPDHKTRDHRIDSLDCTYDCPLFHSNDVDNGIKLAMATPINIQEVENPIYEAVKFTPSLNRPTHRNKRLMAFSLMLLILIGAVVALAVVYSTKSLKYIPIEPTASPTSAAERDMFYGVKETIEKAVLKRNATFSNMTKDDPRLLALDWLLLDDEMELEVGDSKLNQRYILALLAFQFDIYGWDTSETNGSLWLESKDECEWHGVYCVDSEVIGLDLSRTNLIGEIPPKISGFRHIEQLELQENCLFGTIPLELGSLSDLNHINLTLNILSGVVSDTFCNLTSLVHLNLAYQYSNHYYNCTSSHGDVVNPEYHRGNPKNDKNQGLRGRILENIVQLKNIKEIDLKLNSLSGSIAPDIQNLIELEILNIENNFFDGTVPEEIFHLTNLKELNLRSNYFSGALPENIGGAEALEEVLDLHYNGQMNGTLPDSMYNLENMRIMILSRNSFEGSINSDIGNMKNLTEFRINDNFFTGTLPSELGLCKNLEIIYIQATNITGTVPIELCQLRDGNPMEEDKILIFEADCLPEGGGPAFIACDLDCCTACCEHSTAICPTS